MLLKFVKVAVRCHDRLAEVPLVASTGVLLEDGGGDERFEDEETTDVDTINPIPDPVPRLVKRGRPLVGLGVELVRVLRIVNPWGLLISVTTWHNEKQR